MQLNLRVTKREILHSLRIYSDEPEPKSIQFNFDKYAKQISDLIINDLINDNNKARDNNSFAICLNGEWGSGKTTLLMKVRDNLTGDQERIIKEQNEKFKVVWFDAWKYERLDPVLSLLQTIKIEYKNRSSTLTDIIKGLTLVFSDTLSRKTLGLSLDEVTQRFESSVDDIKNLPDILNEVIGKERKLIVFIDNLDRCSIDNALDILESIKSIFNAKNAIFIVAFLLILFPLHIRSLCSCSLSSASSCFFIWYSIAG